MSKYAVDVHWDVAKVFYDIDAASPEEAERIVAEKCRELNVAPCDAVLSRLENAGFEACSDGYEINVSGEKNPNGGYEFH